MKIYSQLQQVQLSLVAPKGQYNSFGKYSYRSAEDILEAVKPLLASNQLVLTLSDEIEETCGDVYIKATAKVTNLDGESLEVTAYAREAKELKGMQPSQITGSTSSYARKYALNGLFCIDDTKDADATNTHNKEVEHTEFKVNVTDRTLSDAQIKRLYAIANSAGVAAELVKFQINARFNKEPKQLTRAEYDSVIKGYESMKK